MLAPAGLMAARDAKGATPPEAPSDVNASQKTDTSIVVDWTDNAIREDNYLLYESQNGGAYSKIATLAGNTEERDVTGLTTGDSYQYKVSAENEAGESTQVESNEVTLIANVPDAPTNLQASAASASQVNLTWTDNAGNEDNYVIYRDGTLFDTIAANSTSYSATGLTEGTEYDWKVGAKNSSGTAFSTTVSQATKLAQPTSLTKTELGPGSGSWRLSWSENSAHEQNVEVLKNGSVFDTVAADTEQYDIACSIAGGSWTVRAIHSSLPDSTESNGVIISC